MFTIMNRNYMLQVKTIVNTLAAAEMEAEQREQAQSAQDGQRAPRTLLLPQEMADQRPHCKYNCSYVYYSITSIR